jgi:hypothetical protein
MSNLGENINKDISLSSGDSPVEEEVEKAEENEGDVGHHQEENVQ